MNPAFQRVSNSYIEDEMIRVKWRIPPEWRLPTTEPEDNTGTLDTDAGAH
jgi:hypothetical protein